MICAAAISSSWARRYRTSRARRWACRLSLWACSSGLTAWTRGRPSGETADCEGRNPVTKPSVSAWIEGELRRLDNPFDPIVMGHANQAHQHERHGKAADRGQNRPAAIAGQFRAGRKVSDESGQRHDEPADDGGHRQDRHEDEEVPAAGGCSGTAGSGC